MNDDFLPDYSNGFEAGMNDFKSKKEFDFHKCYNETNVDFIDGWKNGWLFANDVENPQMN